MKYHIQENPNEHGSAILMVLGVLSLLLVLALVFAMTSRNAQIISDAGADQTNADMLAESAVTLASESLFYAQNKGGVVGTLNNYLPDDTNDLGQSSSSNLNDYKYSGSFGIVGGKVEATGLQPYVGYFFPKNSVANPLSSNFNEYCRYGELSGRGAVWKTFETRTQKDSGTTYPDGGYAKARYVSVFYSHQDDNIDEAHGIGSTANTDLEPTSLYATILNTKVGAFLVGATQDTGASHPSGGDNYFEDLLKGTIGDKKNQLQFINVLENGLPQAGAASSASTPQHIARRYGYLAFSDGSKFDLNQLIRADDYAGTATAAAVDLPSVTGGKLDPAYDSNSASPNTYTLLPFKALSSSLPQQSIQPGESAYAVMGYDYTTPENEPEEMRNNGEVVEGGTVQYGLHPLELRVQDVYQQKIQRRGTASPRWFSYLQLMDPLSQVYADFQNDFFRYGTFSGTEDGEFHFAGNDADFATMKSNAASGTPNMKANIAFPWGLYEGVSTPASCPLDDGNINKYSWDDIGKKMSSPGNSSAFKTASEHFFEKHLGLKKDNLFFDDSGNDLTPQVFANMVDFCDSDNTVTMAFDGTRIDYGSPLSGQSLSTTSPKVDQSIEAPAYCGNERVPAVIGVNVAFDALSTNLNVTSTEKRSGGSLQGYKMTISGNAFNITPNITLSVQNFLNEKLEFNNLKYRVIVQGKIVPVIMAKQVNVPVLFSILKGYQNVTFVNGKTTPLAPAWQWKNTAGVANDLSDYGLDYASLNDTSTNDIKKEINDSTTGFFTMEQKSVFATAVAFDPLENKVVTITGSQISIPLNFPTSMGNMSSGTNNYYQTGEAFLVRVDKIVVVVEADNDTAEFAYMDHCSTSTGSTQNNLPGTWRLVEKHESSGAFSAGAKNFGTEIASVTPNIIVDGASCLDPRMNHQSDDWIWFGQSSTGSSALPTVSGISYGRLGANAEGVMARVNVTANLQAMHFSQLCLDVMENSLHNDSSNDRDWEPAFKNLSLTGGKLNTTLSTYFIPNYPFTSLWQLGAVHRGERGRTLNLKKFGTDNSGNITNKYEDGDAWLLDYVNLSELDQDHSIRGKFNPNCFHVPAYRYLFANIPANTDAKETLVYAPGYYNDSHSTRKLKHNQYFCDLLKKTPGVAGDIDLEDDVFTFNPNLSNAGASASSIDLEDVMKAQSWSPIQAFFNFIEVNGGRSGVANRCNDRQAESLIGCTAGLLSTRYETFTVIAVGQSVKYLENITNTEMSDPDFKKLFANPVQLEFDDNGTKKQEWYSILSTQVRLVTLVRDCWFGKITVVKSQTL